MEKCVFILQLLHRYNIIKNQNYPAKIFVFELDIEPGFKSNNGN